MVETQKGNLLDEHPPKNQTQTPPPQQVQAPLGKRSKKVRLPPLVWINLKRALIEKKGSGKLVQSR